MTWVLDSSIAVAWCFEDESTPRTDALLDRLDSDAAVVPLHWPLEVTNVLRNAVRRRRLTGLQCTQKVAALMSLQLKYDTITHQVAFTAIYQLAERYALTTYDAAYLELAVRLGAPLATNDADLIKAARHRRVELL